MVMFCLNFFRNTDYDPQLCDDDTWKFAHGSYTFFAYTAALLRYEGLELNANSQVPTPILFFDPLIPWKSCQIWCTYTFSALVLQISLFSYITNLCQINTLLKCASLNEYVYIFTEYTGMHTLTNPRRLRPCSYVKFTMLQ